LALIASEFVTLFDGGLETRSDGADAFPETLALDGFAVELLEGDDAAVR
jgi:hypothetical protein